MKIKGRMLCALLSAAMVFSAAGCGKEVKKETVIPEITIGDEGDNANISAAQSELRQKIKDKGGDLTILCAYNEESYLGQCLVQQYKALCGGTLTFVTAGYGDMQQKLATLHQSGQDPDIYWMTNQDFPSLMYKNILLPLNEHIDFSGEVWNNKKEWLEKLAWDGNCYFVPSLEPDGYFYWNRTLLEQAGIPENEMPDALVKANNWTWDTFYDLVKRATNTANGIYGFGQNVNLCYQITAATGEDFIKYGDDGFVSNVKSANITRAMNEYKKWCDTNYYVPVGSDVKELFKRGKLAFMQNNTLITDNEIFSEMYKDGTIDVTFVPRDPQQSEYIFMGNIGGYAIPIGAKNVEAAVAFLEMFQASDYYAEQLEKYDVHERYNLDEKAIEFLKKRKEYKIVPCFSLGVKEIQQLTWSAIGRSEGQLNYGSTTWESVAASLEPQINNELNKLG